MRGGEKGGERGGEVGREEGEIAIFVESRSLTEQACTKCLLV